MIKGIRENFRKGLDRLKWFASLFSERLKIELVVVRLLFESEEKSKIREELLRTIGERVLELEKSSNKNIAKDRVIADARAEIDKLDKDIDELKQKASDISSVAN
jgi:hypothetical protein